MIYNKKKVWRMTKYYVFIVMNSWLVQLREKSLLLIENTQSGQVRSVVVDHIKKEYYNKL